MTHPHSQSLSLHKAQIQWQQRGARSMLGSQGDPGEQMPAQCPRSRDSALEADSLCSWGRKPWPRCALVELKALTGCFAAWSLHQLSGATRGFPCPVTDLGRASRAQWCPCLAQSGVLPFKHESSLSRGCVINNLPAPEPILGLSGASWPSCDLPREFQSSSL